MTPLHSRAALVLTFVRQRLVRRLDVKLYVLGCSACSHQLVDRAHDATFKIVRIPAILKARMEPDERWVDASKTTTVRGRLRGEIEPQHNAAGQDNEDKTKPGQRAIRFCELHPSTDYQY